MTALPEGFVPPKWICPKCGSDAVDHPRTYGPNMRLIRCSSSCNTCGHEAHYPSINQAFDAWRPTQQETKP